MERDRAQKPFRELMRHPWVTDPFDDGNQEPVEDKAEAQEVDGDRIMRWIAEVEGSPDIGHGGQAQRETLFGV